VAVVVIEITYTHSPQDDPQRRVTRGRTQWEQLCFSFILIGSHLLLTHHHGCSET